MDDFELPENPAQLDGSRALAQVRKSHVDAYRHADTLRKLSALTAVARAAERLSEALGQQQKMADAIAEHLFADVIPEIMDDHGIDSLALTDKDAIKLKDDVKAAITQENRRDALAALIELDHDGVIKWGLNITIDRGTSVADVDKAREQLRELGFPSTDNSSVHASTLCALAREMLTDGYDMSQPTPAMLEKGDERSLASLLSLFVRRRAAIVTAKGKASRKKKQA